MSFEIFASGNVATAPVERQIRGVQYLSFTLASNVNLDDHGESANETQWLDCLVAGPLLMRAARIGKGHGVWVRGHATLREYSQGNRARRAWQLTVTELITAVETYKSE